MLLKLETLQHTGSFKFRGAYNRLAQLDAAQRAAGVVAFSSGNHAQGVAAAARCSASPRPSSCRRTRPRVKMRNTLALGAEVIEYDRLRESREEIAARLAAERGAVLVPSFDDPDIIAGQGTVGPRDRRTGRGARASRSTTSIVCTSGGGLVAGTALAIRALSPATRVWTAEPEGHDDHRRSLASGRRERTSRARARSATRCWRRSPAC